jgi:hypothetical protein
MNSDFIFTRDNVFNLQECKKLIKTYKKNLKLHNIINYYYNDISIKEFKFLDRLSKLINIYIKTYPEINLTPSFWALDTLKFKLFKKGQSFKNYHSEVGLPTPYRVLSLQIYLTNHKCGTEFYRSKKIIESKIGRVCIFPAYFTHTHRGQIDLKKERSIITGYYSFCKHEGKIK